MELTDILIDLSDERAREAEAMLAQMTLQKEKDV